MKSTSYCLQTWRVKGSNYNSDWNIHDLYYNDCRIIPLGKMNNFTFFNFFDIVFKTYTMSFEFSLILYFQYTIINNIRNLQGNISNYQLLKI
jgi:hypothetical protein